MAPKKAKKISLNEFLGDSALGSWADEMDSLPNAPAARSDEDQGRGNDRYGTRDNMLSSRPDRLGPPREDIPIPTQPPYTAFVGNLAFDLTEQDLEQFFGDTKTKSIKIIKDRDEKPKGFGYVEFEDVEGLKDALQKSGSNFSGRTVRISVAEPPKERSGFGGLEDDAKFDNPWRRDGPLPDVPASRDSSRRRFDSSTGERSLPGVSEGPNDWRSSRPSRSSEPEIPSFKRKTPGFIPQDGQASAADKEEVWSIGSKFKPAAPTMVEDSTGSKFGSSRGKSDMGPPKESVNEESDWRSSARPRPIARTSISPNSSTPPTPQLNRRKLELLPRSGNASASPSPLSSPKIGPTPPVSNPSRSNPFGAAKPVDVTTREKEVAERLEKDREANKDKLSMSRTSSRTAIERTPIARTRTPPPSSSNSASLASMKSVNTLIPNVRPTLSFANVAANKSMEIEVGKEDAQPDEAADITNKTAELGI
ncbi:hypothetical protein BDQ12DRAFT_680318 [Crucibulum laeve]|uniref:RRM domain-containing protein n=1 Tax=Crucibulum laeve TaxID=68775 RepID=A0A5C3M8B2_9AGAR|nr:hypothetical protein BDQ12DRAFT_680318 [Crucibulum laeve]